MGTLEEEEPSEPAIRDIVVNYIIAALEDQRPRLLQIIEDEEEGEEGGGEGGEAGVDGGINDGSGGGGGGGDADEVIGNEAWVEKFVLEVPFREQAKAFGRGWGPNDGDAGYRPPDVGYLPPAEFEMLGGSDDDEWKDGGWGVYMNTGGGAIGDGDNYCDTDGEIESDGSASPPPPPPPPPPSTTASTLAVDAGLGAMSKREYALKRKNEMMSKYNSLRSKLEVERLNHQMLERDLTIQGLQKTVKALKSKVYHCIAQGGRNYKQLQVVPLRLPLLLLKTAPILHQPRCPEALLNGGHRPHLRWRQATTRVLATTTCGS